MSRSFKDSLGEFLASNISKIGVVFLILVLSLSVFTVATYPLDYGTRYWNNPKYWVDNPKAAQPSWVNYFANPKLLEHKTPTINRPVMEYPTLEGDYFKFYNVSYQLDANQFPTFTILKIQDVTYFSTAPSLKLSILRPDGRRVELLTFTIEPPQEGEQSPYTRYNIEPRRVLLSGENQLAASLSKYLINEYNITLAPSQIIDIGYEPIIFGELTQENSFKPLTGTYQFSLILNSRDSRDEIGTTTFVIGGQLYGVMGTDTLGRDLSQGLLFGFPVALLIGFLTAIATTAIGAGLGIVGGYSGGRTDDVIQRISDIVNNLPQLPLLIFLTFVFGGNLWVIVVVLIAFGWPQLVIVVRSMILQIKSASFVEAAVSLGSSRWRIMGRHIFPQVAPFILSQMIFYTPSAILAEAALSFLGLGDPSIPTWGQILEYGFSNGAVFLGYWWWVLPPGLLIVFSSVTFVFIALGLEPVVNPRLRRWR